MQNKKICSRKKIIEVVKQLKKENKKIVFTNGCFDLLHSGHIFSLEKAKEFADVLIVGVNADNLIAHSAPP